MSDEKRPLTNRDHNANTKERLLERIGSWFDRVSAEAPTSDETQAGELKIIFFKNTAEERGEDDDPHLAALSWVEKVWDEV